MGRSRMRGGDRERERREGVVRKEKRREERKVPINNKKIRRVTCTCQLSQIFKLKFISNSTCTTYFHWFCNVLYVFTFLLESESRVL